MSNGLDDRTYRARRDALKAKTRNNNLPCWICGNNTWCWNNWKDPQAFTADHVNPRSKGGKLLGQLKPAHRSCNASRGNRVTIVTQQPEEAKHW